MPVTSVIRALVVLLASCGGSSGPAPVPRTAPTVIATPRLTSGDLEVGKVNGRPVWSSCVATQARALPVAAGTVDQRRAEALDQCIAFELLAQAAETHGLAATHEVADATRTASVNRLVELDFEQRYRTADDLAPLIDLAMKRNEWRMHIVQLRSSTYARFVVPPHAPPALDARAHALAERLATELAGETGLFNVHLIDAAKRIAAGSDLALETADVKPMHHDDLVEPYAAALYAIPEVGRIAPAVRTPWGWDVVLWTGGVEPKETAREALVAEIFPLARHRQFQLWVTQLAKQLGVHIEIDPATAGRLDTEGAP
ncbi:MAG TPA: hypothetical protein VHN14_13140 [Kofleriaceae bacterium]|jgi:hypothetical protein|nr:hypothetical protein [Kofleriaceae bacterium]